MAFVNEYATQEDIEKYGLAELHEHYTKLADRGGYYEGLDGKDPWIVDREREIWFMRVGFGRDSGDIPPMPTGKDYYILHYKGRNVEVLMHENRKEGSKNVYDNPFRMCWEVLSIKPELFNDVTTQEIINLITEAMITRGYVFLGKQLPNIVVKVKYLEGQS